MKKLLLYQQRCTEQRHDRDARSAERRNLNVREIKCSKILVGVSRMDRVRNEEVR